MDGPSHHTKAEELAGHAESLIEAGDVDGLATAWAVVAQVHAALATLRRTRSDPQAPRPARGPTSRVAGSVRPSLIGA